MAEGEEDDGGAAAVEADACDAGAEVGGLFTGASSFTLRGSCTVSSFAGDETEGGAATGDDDGGGDGADEEVDGTETAPLPSQLREK